MRTAVVCALLLAACGGGPPAEPSPPPSPTPPRAAEPPPVEAGRAPRPGLYAPGVDVLHYDVELSLPAASDTVRGRARIRLVRAGGDVGGFALDLTGLAVDRVRVGPADPGIPADTVDPALYRDDLLHGKLPVPLAGVGGPGDTLDVEVLYRGVPDDGLILGTTLHGRPSVFADNWPNRARFWFPSVDHPSDKATVAFTIHAPSSWQVVANGVREDASEAGPAEAPGGRDRDDDLRTWRWRTRIPIPTYTMVVGATEFAVRSVGLAACGRAPASPREDGCVEVSTWLYPSDSVRASRSFRRAAEMVDVFTAMIGPFPYEKLAHVQSATRFGGMENVTAIFYSESALASGRDIEGTVAHEVAHQWFGDAVTEADWHHLWLSEGFATYFGALFFERTDGLRAFRARMDESRLRYESSDVTDRPVVDPDEDDLFDLLNANNYQKGAWILHMLRGILGDEAFFRGIREYYRRHLHGTVLTEEFRRVMEEVSRQELGWFFDQWIFRPGYPEISTEWSWNAAREEARVVLRQTQADDWPVFRIPAELGVLLPDGTEHRQAVVLDGRSTEVRIPTPSRPEAVVFDPDHWVLHRAPRRSAPEP